MLKWATSSLNFQAICHNRPGWSKIRSFIVYIHLCVVTFPVHASDSFICCMLVICVWSVRPINAWHCSHIFIQIADQTWSLHYLMKNVWTVLHMSWTLILRHMFDGNKICLPAVTQLVTSCKNVVQYLKWSSLQNLLETDRSKRWTHDGTACIWCFHRSRKHSRKSSKSSATMPPLKSTVCHQLTLTFRPMLCCFVRWMRWNILNYYHFRVLE